MLGETYELVMKDFKFVCEKISHLPIQTFCFILESENYRFLGYNTPAIKFKLNGGKGMLQFD